MELKASSGAGALEASQELRHWKNREELDTGTGSIARSWPLEALYGTGGVSRQQSAVRDWGCQSAAEPRRAGRARPGNQYREARQKAASRAGRARPAQRK